MDQNKRLLLFLVVSAVVLFGWNLLFPPAQPEIRPAGADSATAAATTPAAPAATRAPRAPLAVPAGTAPERLVTVRSPLYEYRFSTRGAALNAATLLRYESYVQKGGSVQLVPRSARDVLAQRVAVGRDTIDFRNVTFLPSASRIDLREGDSPRQLRFVSSNPGPVRAEVTYTFRADGYLVDVQGRFTGLPRGGQLVTELGTGLAPHDDPGHNSTTELSFVGWDRDKIRRTAIRKVQWPDTIAGPLVWGGIKDKYFLVALINPTSARFTRLVMEPAPDVRYTVANQALASPRARGRVVQPLAADGTFRMQAYVGPQEHERLAAVGHELEEVNPYGYRWLRPVVRPIAAVVLWALKGMHDLGLTYGWVLILFGIIVRLATWPLNARAMRAQMKNMAIQPQLQARIKEVQAKHSGDPARMNQEMMAVYAELGVSPLSMMSGCLPLLIPMPVLITLFFVFQSAIEFRGASFWWLPDLSLRDPLNLLPIFLVISMFLLQYVSTKMSGIEQNEQTRMMMYTMPLVMGFVFFVMPAGLNLYYASTNVASFPQQILIAQERRRATEKQKAEEAAKKAALRPNRVVPGARGKRR